MHELERQIFYFFSFIPFPPGVVLPALVTLSFCAFAIIATRHIDLVPTPIQNLAEWLYEQLEGFVKTIVGPDLAAEFLPFFATLFIFILCENLLGIIPGLKSPTSTFSNCVALAVVVFFMTHYIGFSRQGLGYLKHFWGDVWWMGPLMFPIHLLGEIARPISLTLRLFGNIMGEDVVILVLTLYLFPVLVPLPMMFMALFTSVLQAMVFTILSGIYISGAAAHAGSHDDEAASTHGSNHPQEAK
ncbi:MAG TPA: F0F1 ATP synthase subunit A [Candidatus Ozemobacteraceae bacterium]|nr:F0F1 ATP synthase subunit A [Candidatus Ozemobacteraceae bacterium]